MKISPIKLIIGIILVTLVWIGSGFIIYFLFPNNERGLIGDMFGAINSLFSGLALFGIIISILIQQEELKLQRLELNKTRQEFKTNRITNILFEQIQNANRQIESLNVDFLRASYADVENISFVKLIAELEAFEKNNYDEKKLLNFVEEQFDLNIEVMELFNTKIYNYFKIFEQTLISSFLDEDDIWQFKSLFRANLTELWVRYFRFYLDYIKLKRDKDEWQEWILDNYFEQISFVYSFGTIAEKTEK